MVSEKLQHLIDALNQRAEQDDFFCPTELAQAAAYLAAILPLVQVMEGQPVPAWLRGQKATLHLIEGGAA